MSTPENRTPRSEESAEVRGRTRRGQECALVDASGDALRREELERLLADLIAADAFGFRATGGPGGAIRVDRPAFAHVQVGGRLYRLIVDRHRARLEKF
jgi:hypothetical protein